MYCPNCGIPIDGTVADALNALTDLLRECKEELGAFREDEIQKLRQEAGE